MAKIAQYRENIRAPSPDGRIPQAGRQGIESSGIFDQQGVQAFSQGARQMQQVLMQQAEDDARAWASNTLSQQRLNWTAEFVNRQTKAAPGAADFTPSLLSDFDKTSEEVMGTAPNRASADFLRERMQDLRTNIGEKALMFEAQSRIDWRGDQYTQAVDNTAKLMNTDPSQFQTALAEQLAVIDSSGMPPIKKSDIRQKAIDRISSAAVWSQIQKSPTQFLESIGFYTAGDKTRRNSGDLTGTTGNPAFDAMPFERRAQMFDNAIRLKAQIDIDADRAATALAKKTSDGAMKDAWDKLYSGKLTLEDVQRIKPLVSDNDYKSLREGLKQAAKPAEVKTDPGVYAQILRATYSGDFAAAESLAFQAQRNGKLTNSDLSTALSHNLSLSREQGPRTEYERSRKWINDTLNPGDMVHDPVGKARLGDAIRSFDDWRITNPKADDKSIRQRAEEVLGQYQFLSLSDTVIALPMPRGTTIRRTTDTTVLNQDILSAARKLQADRDSKKMSTAEYEQEMATLNRWRKAAEKK